MIIGLVHVFIVTVMFMLNFCTIVRSLLVTVTINKVLSYLIVSYLQHCVNKLSHNTPSRGETPGRGKTCVFQSHRDANQLWSVTKNAGSISCFSGLKTKRWTQK